MKQQYIKPFAIAAIIVIVDQLIKTWVRTHLSHDQSINILGEHGKITFVENKGMAFGWEIPGSAGKLILTFFRLFAVFGIGYGLVYLINHKYSRGLIICVALIFAGAFGNIVDSTFYGLIYQNVGLFEGKVIDMFYFPLITGTYPTWVPFLHDKTFKFFEPVFNLADAAISIGVITILIFQKRYFKQETEESINLNNEIAEE